MRVWLRSRKFDSLFFTCTCCKREHVRDPPWGKFYPPPPFVLLRLSSSAPPPVWICLVLLRSGGRNPAPVLRKPGAAGGEAPPIALILVLLPNRARTSSALDTLVYSSASLGPLVRHGDSLGILLGRPVRNMLVLPVPSGLALAIIGGFLRVRFSIGSLYWSPLWFSIGPLCGFPVVPFLVSHWPFFAV